MAAGRARATFTGGAPATVPRPAPRPKPPKGWATWVGKTRAGTPRGRGGHYGRRPRTLSDGRRGGLHCQADADGAVAGRAGKGCFAASGLRADRRALTRARPEPRIDFFARLFYLRGKMKTADAAPLILIADDQPDVLEALRLLLKGEGYRTKT